jgi:hypothetical protein
VLENVAWYKTNSQTHVNARLASPHMGLKPPFENGIPTYIADLGDVLRCADGFIFEAVMPSAITESW